MIIRPYDKERDKDALMQVWHECAWIDKTDQEAVRQTDDWFASCRAFVGESAAGRAECIVTIHDGAMSYDGVDLPMAAVSGVATGMAGRKQGLAGAVTAHAIAETAGDLPVAALGMFEQGFYNRLGFGTGPYERHFRFDPANLNVRGKPRPPVRLTQDDFREVHECRLRTPRRHGGQVINDERWTQFRMLRATKGFGLGYRGDDGRLTHCLWFTQRKGWHGPLSVHWCAYETLEGFMELMALLKSLGDQIRTVAMREPPGIHLQDLMRYPGRESTTREKGEHAAGIRSFAHWQLRINDLERCLAATRLRCDPIRFNLRLSDPIEGYLAGHEWTGAGGDYVVTLGEECACTRGEEGGLPVLEAAVNAFSRMWLGVLPATTLAVTDEMSGPCELLEALDYAFRLPAPRTAWSF